MHTLHHPTAKAAVDIQRLQLAAHLQRLAPISLRALLQQPGAAEWKQELAEAAAIMRCMLAPKLDELPSPLTEQGLEERLNFTQKRPTTVAGFLCKWRLACSRHPDWHGKCANNFHL